MVSGRSDITRLAIGVTVCALVVVTCALMLLYPREQWAWEFTVSWPLTTLICFTATRYVGNKLLEITELNKKLQRLLDRDHLTDAATRDHFFACLEADPDAKGICLMLDIDHFKKVNDTHGHLVGDKVIAQVADVIKANVRPLDIVCRFGGEEFVVFLRNTTPRQALETAERVRGAVAASSVEEAGTIVSVSISVGGSLICTARDVEMAIKQADDALYRAKEAGRNAVRMAGPGEDPETHRNDVA